MNGRLRKNAATALWMLIWMGWCVVPVRGSDMHDRLTVIREAFRDGIDGLVRREAGEFLKLYGGRSVSDEVRLILGIVEARSGNRARAIRLFEKASRSSDRHVSAQAAYRLGRIFWTGSRYGDAAAAFQRAWEAAPADAGRLKRESGYWRAVSLFRTGAYAAAVTAFDEIMDVLPDDTRRVCRFMKGQALLKSGRLSDAEAILGEIAAEGDPDFGYKAAVALASDALNRNDYKAADAWAESALRIKQTCFAFRIRAQAAAAVSRWACAADCLDEAERAGDCKAGEDAIWAFRRALYRSRAVRDENGMRSWFILLRFACHHPAYRSAVLAEWVSDTEHAPPPELTFFLAGAFKWDTGDDEAHLVSALATSGFPDAAMYRLTEHLLRENGGARPTASNMLQAADLLRRLGDKDAAVRILDELPVLENGDADNAGVAIARADILFKMGEYMRSAALYQEWLTRAADTAERAEGLFRLGESYFRGGEYRLAQQAFKMLLSIVSAGDPRHEATIRRCLVIAGKNKRWLDVIRLSDTYLETYPDTEYTGDVLFQRGIALADTGDDTAAIKALSGALDRTSRPEYVESIKACIRRVTARKAKREPTAGTAVPGLPESDGRKEKELETTPVP